MALRNQYATAAGGSYYETTPKAVWAALAVSLAARVFEVDINDEQALREALRSEWTALFSNGIVPQPTRILRAGKTAPDEPANGEDRGMTEHEHIWGSAEESRMSGTMHRKCTVPGCRAVSLDFEDYTEDPEEVAPCLVCGEPKPNREACPTCQEAEKEAQA